MPRSQWEPWLLFRKAPQGRIADNLRTWRTGGLRRIGDGRPFGDVIRSAPTGTAERRLGAHPSLKPQEFLRQVRARLRPGGLYVQWAPTERAIETFRSVFPHVTLVHPALLGSDRPIAHARDSTLKLLAQPEIDGRLKLARVDRAELRAWFESKKIEPLNAGETAPTPSPNTDFFPRDEYYLNR